MSNGKISLEAFRSLQKEYQDTRKELVAARRELRAARVRMGRMEEDGRRLNAEWNARLGAAQEEKAPGDILAESIAYDPKRKMSERERGMREVVFRWAQSEEPMDVTWALCWGLRLLVKKNFGEAVVIRTFLATREPQDAAGDEVTT